MRSALRRLALAGATGAIFVVYSERMFWSEWRPVDNAGATTATWVVYSVAAWACLLLIRHFRARSLAAMMMIGAVLGWLVEGVFAMTFFGVADMPFPITIVWTGLAWHALIAVLLGWYGMQLALLRSLRHSLALGAALGLLWGVWALFWEREAPPVPWPPFLLHASVATLVLAVAFRAGHWLDAAAFRASRVDAAVIALLVLAWFGLVTVPTAGVLTLLLVGLLALVWLALRGNAARERRADFLVLLGQPIPWSRMPALAAIPLVATLVHEAGRAGADSPRTNLLVLALTVPVAGVGFLVSLWSLLLRRRAVP